MASEMEQFFTELLYGSGAMIGVILISILLLMLVLRVKFGSALTIPISCILIVLYWDNLPSSSIAMWNTFILFCGMCLMLYIEVKRKG